MWLSEEGLSIAQADDAAPVLERYSRLVDADDVERPIEDTQRLAHSPAQVVRSHAADDDLPVGDQGLPLHDAEVADRLSPWMVAEDDEEGQIAGGRVAGQKALGMLYAGEGRDVVHDPHVNRAQVY